MSFQLIFLLTITVEPAHQTLTCAKKIKEQCEHFQNIFFQQWCQGDQWTSKQSEQSGGRARARDDDDDDLRERRRLEENQEVSGPHMDGTLNVDIL